MADNNATLARIRREADTEGRSVVWHAHPLMPYFPKGVDIYVVPKDITILFPEDLARYWRVWMAEVDGCP